MALLSGCAVHEGRPPVKIFDVPAQGKLKSASHWAVVANDVALNIKNVETVQGRPIFFIMDEKTQFEKIFSPQLQSGLVSQGVPVAVTATNALTLKVRIDSVRHEIIETYRPGTMSSLAAGIQVARGIETASQVLNIASALAIAEDIYRSNADNRLRPRTEIAITVAVDDGAKLIFSRTDVYYIEDADERLFREPERPRTYRIVGGQ
jgi:hypothetical protein